MIAELEQLSNLSSTGRLAWPIIALAGLLGGILLGLKLWWGSLIILAGILFAVLDRKYWFVLLALASACLGFAELYWQKTQPDPMHQWVGGLIKLKGHWDGQFLSLSDPKARVALAPKPLAPPGQLTVSGRLIRPQGRRIPGGFDQEAWLHSQGGLFLPTPTTVLVKTKVEKSTPEGGLRGWFRRGLTANLNERHAALMQAVELGERNDIGRETFKEGYSVRDAFNRSGLAHLMALSGQNVALITGAILMLLLFIQMPLAYRYLIAIVLLIVYFFLLISISPSITRAVIMGMAGLIGLAIGRGKPDPLGIIALAALICLIFFPMWVLDIGFQLSFLAVLALTQTNRLTERLPKRWPTWLKMGIAATLLAELGTLPVIAHQFGQLPVVGLPANLLAAPIMVLLVPLGFLAGLLGPAAVIINWLNAPLAAALLWVAETFGQAPVMAWGNIGAGGFIGFGIVALALVGWLNHKIRGQAALLTLISVALLTWLPGQLRPAKEIVFIDVGQGDATLIRLPKLSMLIDAGGSVGSDYDVGARTVIPALRAIGMKKLDVMLITHADTDHAEGVLGVMKSIPIGELWLGHRQADDPLLKKILTLAEIKKIPIREVRRGDQFQSSDMTFRILWPTGKHWSSSKNDNSVALVIEKTGHPKDFRAAFLGDLSSPAEHMIGPGKLTLLKAAHHGSNHSTSTELLQQTTPQDVVISVGRNTYGHPHPDVIKRSQQAKAKVWRTDQSGTIRWKLE